MRRALTLHARHVRASCSCRSTIRRRSSPSATARRSSSASARTSSSSPPTSRPSSAHTRDVVFLGDEEMAVITRSGVAVHRLQRPRRLEDDAAGAVGSDRGGEGRPQALHAQGDLRAADRRARHDPRPRLARPRADLPRGPEHLRRDASAPLQKVTIIACGTSWHAGLVGKYLIEALAQVPVEVDYGSEYRYRNPIVGGERAGDRHHAVGRDRRHAGGAARGDAQGRQQHRHLQRRRQHGHARGRRHRLHARRAGDRRRLDQGVHVAARRAAAAGALHGAGARHAVAEPTIRGHIEELLQLPQIIEQAIKASAADREGRRAVLQPHRLPVPRPRHQLPDRARGRAQAEGNLLHPRRRAIRPAR